MTHSNYDADGITPNQKLLLEYVEVGAWFAPDENRALRYVQTRTSACRSLAKKGLLLQRSTTDRGWLEIEYMLPARTAKQLSIVHRLVED